MFLRLSNVLTFVGPFLSYKMLGNISPVLAGFKITNNCNLKCKHCPYWKRSGKQSDYYSIINTMDRLRNMGVRILILEGGEPLLWRDGQKTFRDLVWAAKQKFSCVCATTNGTLPWNDLPLDKVWVSLDGTEQIHDSIRGAGVFAKVLKNVSDSGANTLASTTISKANYHNIPELVRMLKGRVAGITIQFYYPYSGLPDPLFVPPDERKPLLDELIGLKRDGFPVANSILSLTQLQSERWLCIDGLLANAEPDGTINKGCYLKNRARANCLHCGFSAHNEMSLAFEGRMQSIMTGLRIFFAS
jgi:Fe-coproporphyrin III synthase